MEENTIEKYQEMLSEFQTKLQQVQQPIDMSDIGSATMIDRRNLDISEKEYGDDEEGHLLKELDKWRLDEKPNIAKISEVVEKIRAVREAKRVKEEEQIKSEVERFETIIDLKQKQAQIEVEIEKLQKQIIKNEDRRKQYLADIVANKPLLLRKTNSEVYKAAVSENKKNASIIKGKTTMIRNAKKKVAELQNEWDRLDGMLLEIDGRKDLGTEQKEQEDEMWKEYNEEKAQNKQKQIDESYKEKEEQEQKEEEQINKNTEKEVEEYYKEQGKGKNNPEPERPTQASKGTKKVSQPTQGKKEQTPGKTITPTNVSNQKEKEDDVEEGIKNSIKSVTCRVNESGIPVYYVEITKPDGKALHFETSMNTEFRTMTAEKAKEIEDKMHITEAEKYYDLNVQSVLESVDKIYGTDGIKQYKDLLRSKNQQNLDMSEMLSISYDFSELYSKKGLSEEQKNNIKQLKSIAKAGSRNVNSIYTWTKEPNIFKKLLKKITTKLLPTGETEKQESVVDQMIQQYINESGERSFSEKRFYQQIHEAEGISLAEEKEIMSRIDKFKQEKVNSTKGSKFKEELKVAPKIDETQQHVAEEVQRMMDEEKQRAQVKKPKEEPVIVDTLDKDGKVIATSEGRTVGTGEEIEH